MAQTKKRLSKSAKAAQKILEDSKLLAASKITNDLREGEHFKSADTLPKTSTANKIRPNKKRG
ncbi:hypothetical protein BH10ACI1_BH10ACI1_04060 [soil metagenome]